MQVTLTPHTEELLRQVLARNPGLSPEQVLEQLLDEQARREAAEVTEPTYPVWERLKTIPRNRVAWSLAAPLRKI